MSTHNILFYSSHPNDKLSQQILSILGKNPLLKDQFAIVCVNSPGIKLPMMIVERNEVPVIVTRGFSQPISGEAALKMIMEHSNSDKALGLEFGDVNKASQVSEDHGILANESGRTSYHQAFNDEWNAGAENDVRTINTSFSSIDDKNEVSTFEEQDRHNTSGLGKMMNQRMNQRDRSRNQDTMGINNPNNRSAGSFTLEQLNQGGRASGPGSMRGAGGNGLMYNPFPNGQPVTPDLPAALRAVETNPGRDQNGEPRSYPQPQFNDYSRLMPGPGGNMQGNNMQGGMRSGGGMRGGPEFMPPQSNPLFPPSRAGGPANQPLQRANVGDFPALPPGFGGVGGGGAGGGGFSSLDSAFTGQSLMGTPMKAGTARGNNGMNDRREKSFGPGLPNGHGHAGPMAQY